MKLSPKANLQSKFFSGYSTKLEDVCHLLEHCDRVGDARRIFGVSDLLNILKW